MSYAHFAAKFQAPRLQVSLKFGIERIVSERMLVGSLIVRRHRMDSDACRGVERPLKNGQRSEWRANERYGVFGARQPRFDEYWLAIFASKSGDNSFKRLPVVASAPWTDTFRRALITGFGKYREPIGWHLLDLMTI